MHLVQPWGYGPVWQLGAMAVYLATRQRLGVIWDAAPLLSRPCNVLLTLQQVLCCSVLYGAVQGAASRRQLFGMVGEDTTGYDGATNWQGIQVSSLPASVALALIVCFIVNLEMAILVNSWG
jgi:hypothetical protein